MGEKTYSIRPAEEGDRKAVMDLLRENYRNAETGLSFEDEMIAGRTEDLISSTVDPDVPHCLYLGVVEGNPVAVGYVVADEKRGGFLVDELYTDPEFEGRGIGSGLLRACEDFVRAQGETEIHLNVLTTDKKVQDFYAKRGWAKQFFNTASDGNGPAQQSDIDPHTYVPTHLLKKQL